MMTFLQINLLLTVTGLFFILAERLALFSRIRLPSVKVLRFAQMLFLLSFALPVFLKLIPETQIRGSQSGVFKVYAEDLENAAPLVQAKVKTARIVKTTVEDFHELSPRLSLETALLILWGMGCFISFVFFIRNFLRIKRTLERSSVLRRQEKIRIVVNQDVFVPFSVQIYRTRWIVLPEHLLMNGRDLKLAIKHELQHHRQGDCLWAMSLEIISVFFFFNPAFGWWKNIITEQQEYSCDEALTGQSGVSSEDYGSCLIRVAETALIHRQMYVGTTSMAAIIKDSNYFKKFLLRRIEMIMDDKASKRTWIASLMGLSLATLTIGLAIGAEKLVRGQSEKINGGNITVDREIQKIADDVLIRALQRTRATAGFIIVADPNTGKILAVANVDKSLKRPAHWALSELMETASIAKPLMVAKGLEMGSFTPEDMHSCENGKYIFNGVEYRDWKKEGWDKLSTTQMIQSSSNICSIKAAEKVGEKNLMKMLEDFGFGENGSAASFPEARVGERPAPGPQFIPEVTIGFGFRSSPLEVLQAYGAIANGGELMIPQSAHEKNPRVARRVLSRENAEKMRILLGRVVKNGTGRKANSDLYSTAGKTATTLYNDFMNLDWFPGANKSTANYAGFIGFAPVSHPEIEVYVGLMNANTDNTGSHGGEHAAPVFKEVVENVLTHLKVTPDKM